MKHEKQWNWKIGMCKRQMGNKAAVAAGRLAECLFAIVSVYYTTEFFGQLDALNLCRLRWTSLFCAVRKDVGEQNVSERPNSTE